MFFLKSLFFFFFFFNDTATTEIYTLSLHDALPISRWRSRPASRHWPAPRGGPMPRRSEEHTSELQSQSNLVCRLLLEKKKKKIKKIRIFNHQPNNILITNTNKYLTKSIKSLLT